MNKMFRNVGMTLGMLAASAGAFAVGTPVDVTAVTDGISAQATPIGAVAAAGLVLAVAVVAYKWIKKAL